MSPKIERLSELRDRIGFTVLAAPDRFPMVGSFGTDQSKNLLLAFERLEEGFPLIENKIKDPAILEQLKSLLPSALAAYQQGDRRKGAHLLQDFQNIVFPDRLKEYEARKIEE